MIGSDTFIIVALRCNDRRTSCSFARRDFLFEELAQRLAVHARRIDDFVRLYRHGIAQNGGLAAGLKLDADVVPPCSTMTDCSLE